MPSNLREGDVVASVCLLIMNYHARVMLMLWTVQWQVDIVVAHYRRVRCVFERVDCGNVCCLSQGKEIKRV